VAPGSAPPAAAPATGPAFLHRVRAGREPEREPSRWNRRRPRSQPRPRAGSSFGPPSRGHPSTARLRVSGRAWKKNALRRPTSGQGDDAVTSWSVPRGSDGRGARPKFSARFAFISDLSPIISGAAAPCVTFTETVVRPRHKRLKSLDLELRIG
jgi:hypothetical protein